MEPCHADGQGPCLASCCPIRGLVEAPAPCPPQHFAEADYIPSKPITNWQFPKYEEKDMTQPEIERAREAIHQWWLDNALEAIEQVAPKAAEYGSTDLAELGRDLAMLMNRDGMSHEELTELGIYMYMLGKFSRWRDAIKDGRRVSLDTIYDIKVYATMAERNRAVGGWPFPIDAEEQN